MSECRRTAPSSALFSSKVEYFIGARLFGCRGARVLFVLYVLLVCCERGDCRRWRREREKKQTTRRDRATRSSCSRAWLLLCVVGSNHCSVLTARSAIDTIASLVSLQLVQRESRPEPSAREARRARSRCVVTVAAERGCCHIVRRVHACARVFGCRMTRRCACLLLWFGCCCCFFFFLFFFVVAR